MLCITAVIKHKFEIFHSKFVQHLANSLPKNCTRLQYAEESELESLLNHSVVEYKRNTNIFKYMVTYIYMYW